MDFHKIWQEQCAATRTIREQFGVKSALDYLVGEKLLNFAREADQNPDLLPNSPAFKQRYGMSSTHMNLPGI